MPEVCEIVLTAHYLLSKLKNKYITKIDILSGRYTHQKLEGKNLISKYSPLKIKNINTKGKFLWFELLNEKNNKYVYIMNTFGLTGSWSFEESRFSRISFNIKNNGKLYYNDMRNFGTIKIVDDKEILDNKLNKLSPDLLKTDFTNKEFIEWVNGYKNQNDLIIKVLMKQERSLGSGLGNYLAPEILYKAKISPYRTLKSLTNKEINRLSKNIKYVVKLCYYNNSIGYMENFGNFIERHRKGIDKGKYPNYHKNVKLNKNDEFKFNVYRQKKDPYGNPVSASKIINSRTTYWVPNIQK